MSIEGLKNNIRNIEKINKRIIHLKSGIHFNEFIYIYISVKDEGLPGFIINIGFFSKTGLG